MPFRPETYNLDNQIDCLTCLEKAIAMIQDDKSLRLVGNKAYMSSLYLRTLKYIRAFKIQNNDMTFSSMYIHKPRLVAGSDGEYEMFIESAHNMLDKNKVRLEEFVGDVPK